MKMSDIAKKAGVSVTSVSHVINGTRSVNSEKRDRVLQIVDELGYRPNVMARALRKSETRAIAVVIPDSTNEFFAQITRSIEESCFERGFVVILCNSAGDIARQSAYLEALADRRVEGLVVVSVDDESDVTVRAAQHRIPLVAIEHGSNGQWGSVIRLRNHDGGAQAARHLIEIGCMNLACIATARSWLPGGAKRARGFVETCREHSLEPRIQLAGDLVASHHPAELEAGYVGMSALLRNSRPDGVFCTNDLMALGAMRAAADAGVAIPEEMAMVGFDDIPLSAYAIPSLTTVAQPSAEMGTRAASLLLSQIETGQPAVESIEFTTTLVVRESTDRHRATTRGGDLRL